jgi:hypothetical protein
MIDKRELFRQLLTQMQDYVAQSRANTEAARNSVCELPGRNETRYDSLRTENGWVVSGMDKRAGQLEMELSQAKSFDLPRESAGVYEGSYVRLSSEGEKREYLVLPFFGGTEIQQGESEITIITPRAPLFQEMRGLGIGEQFEFRGKNYRVEEVR